MGEPKCGASSRDTSAIERGDVLSFRTLEDLKFEVETLKF